MDKANLSEGFRRVYEGPPPPMLAQLGDMITSMVEKDRLSPHVAIVCLLSHATMVAAASAPVIDSGELIRVLQSELDDTLQMMEAMTREQGAG